MFHVRNSVKITSQRKRGWWVTLSSRAFVQYTMNQSETFLFILFPLSQHIQEDIKWKVKQITPVIGFESFYPLCVPCAKANGWTCCGNRCMACKTCSWTMMLAVAYCIVCKVWWLGAAIVQNDSIKQVDNGYSRTKAPFLRVVYIHTLPSQSPNQSPYPYP